MKVCRVGISIDPHETHLQALRAMLEDDMRLPLYAYNKCGFNHLFPLSPRKKIHQVHFRNGGMECVKK